MSGGPFYGDPMLISVWESNLNRAFETADIDNFSSVEFEPTVVAGMRAEVQTYGGAQLLYLCIPIGRVHTDDPGHDDDATNAPHRVVTADVDDQFVRMANAAAAMGVTK
jgi:hypothetical protein